MSGPHPDPLADMLSKPHELDGRFEPEAKTVTTCISDAALTSIAVSLKRIADASPHAGKVSPAQHRAAMVALQNSKWPFMPADQRSEIIDIVIAAFGLEKAE